MKRVSFFFKSSINQSPKEMLSYHGCLTEHELLAIEILENAKHWMCMQVRGAAAVVFAESLSKLQPADWPRATVDEVLKIVAKLVSDNTPDARNSAKRIIPMLHAAYDCQVSPSS